ncbi:MAG TPA: hypothetical protein VF791_03660 [Pyrinomonadaceae bacterium]
MDLPGWPGEVPPPVVPPGVPKHASGFAAQRLSQLDFSIHSTTAGSFRLGLFGTWDMQSAYDPQPQASIFRQSCSTPLFAAEALLPFAVFPGGLHATRARPSEKKQINIASAFLEAPFMPVPPALGRMRVCAALRTAPARF